MKKANKYFNNIFFIFCYQTILFFKNKPQLSSYFQIKTLDNDLANSHNLEENLYKQLFTKFGYTEFKSETQKNACLLIAKAKYDVYISMPTGLFFNFYSTSYYLIKNQFMVNKLNDYQTFIQIMRRIIDYYCCFFKLFKQMIFSVKKI